MGIEEDLAALAQSVAAMRALGVVEWRDIKLGPAPVDAPPRPHAPPMTAEMQDRERLRRLFQSSGVSPEAFLSMFRGT